jgi:hypothetical protein
MTDERERQMILEAIANLGTELRRELSEMRSEMRGELQALRRGVEYIGEHLFGPQGKPELQSRDELAEFRSRMKVG